MQLDFTIHGKVTVPDGYPSFGIMSRLATLSDLMEERDSAFEVTDILSGPDLKHPHNKINE